MQGRNPPFGLSAILEIVVFLAAVILLQIPMLYVVGSEEYYSKDQHPLSPVFEEDPKYRTIIDQLSNPKEKYFIISAEEHTGVINFLESFACSMRETRPVVFRYFSEDGHEAIYAVFRYAKALIENQIDLKEDKPELWILFAFRGDLPKPTIHEIQVENPEDKIILVTSKDSKLKGFKKIKFPALKIDQLKQTTVNQLELD